MWTVERTFDIGEKTFVSGICLPVFCALLRSTGVNILN